jgi:Zc3h12a-like Ribonuclease NYN domain
MAEAGEVVIIDGANVAYEERSAGGKPKLSNLLKVRRELEERGLEAVILVDASLKYDIDDQSQLETLIRSQQVRQVPAGTDADYFIIQLADQFNARVVTNDRYKDYLEQFPWITDRRLPYMIVKGEVVLYDEAEGERLEAGE